MPGADPQTAEPRAGERRRRRILDAAADLSTAEGLEGLSIGRLAHEVGMSKSGVAAHFDSKEALQLAAVEAAAEQYAGGLEGPAADAEPGLARLRRMMEAWLDHIEALPYRAGCFFAAAGAALAGRPGPVRDRVAFHTQRWIRALEAEARLAARLGELEPRVDARRLAFQLHALVQEANLRRQLLDEDGAFDDARALLADVLDGASRPAPDADPDDGGRR